MIRPTIRFQPARHKRVANGHPWVYSNEIVMDGAAKTLEAGCIATFVAHDGTHLGWGSFNPRTLIAGRIFDRTPLGEPDEDWFAARFSRALALRTRLVPEPYYRLIHAEADGLPGLIVDRFGPTLCLQANTAGMDRLLPTICAALDRVLDPQTIIAHNESSVRTLEGVPLVTTVLKGHKPSGEKTKPEMLRENGIAYYADLWSGQKTGWYFDQRDNHALAARYAADQDVLDLYCHAGGFGLLAAKAGARRVVGVDSSQNALDLAAQGAVANGVESRCVWHRADVFDDLEKRIAAKEKYGLVLADPPPFVKSRKDLAAGARGYRKVTRLAAGVTASGGCLAVMSCSHNMTQDLLIEEIGRGLSEARRTGRILHTLSAAPDHPTHPLLPESAYLHGAFLILD